MNMGRDFKPDITADIALVKEGLTAPDGSGLLSARRGIEVGNIFQLGFHYSSKMKDADFIDKDGRRQPFYMGCYGIGLGRAMATVVEIYHDERGIVWPGSVAPFQVHLVGLDMEGERVKGEAERVYKLLQAENVEVLFDDRVGVSAGAKFADADLIGIPYRIVISKKTEDKIELKKRSEKETKFVSFEQLLQIVKDYN